MKRLTGAGHYVGASSTPSLTDTERGITYDRNGNITHLKRYGSTGLENDLTFTHTGNRMTSLSDANATGSASGSKSFTYDENGNLISDGRKGLEMRWNVLNLLDSAGVHGSSLKYSWLSDGTKVSASEDDGKGNVIKRHYVGSFVFVEDPESGEWAKESVGWDEGRIFFDVPFIVDSTVVDDPLVEDRGYRDCWYATDHLGNVRAVIDITPGLPAPQIVEQCDYLPFGTKILNPAHASMQANRWRYAGKEEQAFGSLNLGLLDFGARLYDPFTARWTAVDPMAGMSYNQSPYNYCSNSPLCAYDLTGETDYLLRENGQFDVLPTYDPYDRIIIGNKSLIVKDQSIMNGMTSINKDRNTFSFTASDSDELFDVFYFLADNTSIEWVVHSFDNGQAILGTKNKTDSSGSVDDYLSMAKQSNENKFENARQTKKIHSHPDVSTDINDELSSMGYPYSVSYSNDFDNYKRQYNKYGKDTPISDVYFPNSKRVYRITAYKPRILKKR